ncbi:hypothetical protein [Phaeovulum sp.]|uniref:hypothetical protein n=1 Tax=Phaeovulum sp. TaxID=2934796 RepID=UPI003563AEEB
MRFFLMFLVFGLATLLSSVRAHAYLDPGTASIILQSLIGGTVAAGAAVSLFWQRIKSFWKRKKPDPDSKTEAK